MTEKKIKWFFRLIAMAILAVAIVLSRLITSIEGESLLAIYILLLLLYLFAVAIFLLSFTVRLENKKTNKLQK